MTQDQQSYESTKNEENFEIANETSVANQLALTMESPQIRASEIVVSELDDSSNVQSNEKLSALSYEDKYKRKKFETGSEGFARIVVSEVVGPDLFYVHLITPDVALLDQMMDELNDFYDNNSFKGRYCDIYLMVLIGVLIPPFQTESRIIQQWVLLRM